MSEWKNGGLLRVVGKNEVSLRILVQDGHVSIRSDGAILSPDGMQKLGQALLEGAEALTKGQTPDTL